MPANDALVKSLKALEAPVAEITMIGPTALGAEFVRWEIATAVAGALLEHQSLRRTKRRTGEKRDT